MSQSDQRSSRRLHAIGTAILTLDGRSLVCAPRDVSMGGAHVAIVETTTDRLPWPGARLRVDFLRPRGRPAFSVDAVVVRVHGTGRELSLRFEPDRVGAERLHRFLSEEARQIGLPVSDLGPMPPADSIRTPTLGPKIRSPWLIALPALAAALAAAAAVIFLID